MKKRIGIDVDGVIRDFSLDLHKVIKEHYPEYIMNEVDTPKEMTVKKTIKAINHGRNRPFVSFSSGRSVR